MPVAAGEMVDIAALPQGLTWNEFQKYYRGFQNGLVAARW
jgi:hypothetical protein